MRNLLGKASVAQSLDGNRLKGSLLSPMLESYSSPGSEARKALLAVATPQRAARASFLNSLRPTSSSQVQYRSIAIEASAAAVKC